MRLLTKITLLYLLTTLLVFGIGGIMAYFIVKGEIDAEHQRFLRQRLLRTIELIRTGHEVSPFDGDKLDVVDLGTGGTEQDFRYSDTLVWHPSLQRMENHYKVSTVALINDRYYLLETYDVIVESDDITDAVVLSMSRIFILLLVALGLIGALFSARIFRPFNLTLERLRRFRLNDRDPLIFPYTNTREFSRLHRILEKMTERSRRDYQALKEFSENASHELQTPLAIARGKLELLLDSPNFSGREMELIISAQQAIQKIAKLGHALSLLTKIENEEFSSTSTVDLSTLLQHMLHHFEELASLKTLHLQTDIARGVTLNMDPLLADILLTNLLQNAVRHNIEGGTITVRLDDSSFYIANTGLPPSVPVDEFFQRFRKDRQSSESLGLGLAIVDRICQYNKLAINYYFEVGEHRITLYFPD